MNVVIATLCCVVFLISLQGTDGWNLSQRVWDSLLGYVRGGIKYGKDFAGGTGDMFRAYHNMLEANTIGADKYFHALGNYNAARRGTGGRHAAALLSEAREIWQSDVSGRGDEDSAKDREANRWGRNGGDPDKYRPEGLDKKYG